MKRYSFLFSALLCLLLLAGCGASDGPKREGSAPDADAVFQETAHRAHGPYDGENCLPHEEVGYCGNTVTTVTCLLEGNEWQNSFWGGDSVALTDLLRYLNYSEEPCACPAEYTVDTEFAAGYSLNLTEGFARWQGKQVALTQEQIEGLGPLLERARQIQP